MIIATLGWFVFSKLKQSQKWKILKHPSNTSLSLTIVRWLHALWLWFFSRSINCTNWYFLACLSYQKVHTLPAIISTTTVHLVNINDEHFLLSQGQTNQAPPAKGSLLFPFYAILSLLLHETLVQFCSYPFHLQILIHKRIFERTCSEISQTPAALALWCQEFWSWYMDGRMVHVWNHDGKRI